MHKCAFQARAGEDAVRSRIRQNFSLQADVRTRCGVAPYRPGGYARIATQTEFVRQQAGRCVFIHKKHHDVSRGNANLWSKAPSANHDEHRITPTAACLPANYHSLATLLA